MTEREFAEKVRELGGRVFLVGGWIRDKLRGIAAHDKDYMVSGLTPEAFEICVPVIKYVGRGFPVCLVDIDGSLREVAFARKERKQGAGYRGFVVDYDASVTVEEDLYRRDTRMNSMAYELPEGTLIDPFGGQADVERHIIDAVSEHFTEDPVRALRAARQAAEFAFTITDRTYAYMEKCREELRGEPTERMYGELMRALAAPRPSLFFEALRRANLLDVTFPEIHALIGQTQPVEYHPEGDAYKHTMLVLDTVATETDSLKARFCGLVHDLGKGVTPKDLLPHHYGHEKTGLDVLGKWNERMTFPVNLRKAASFVIREHMRAPNVKKQAKQAELLLSIEGSTLSLSEFCAVIRADGHGYLPEYLEHGEEYLSAMLSIRGADAPSHLTGPKIRDWLRQQRVKCFHSLQQSGKGKEM